MPVEPTADSAPPPPKSAAASKANPEGNVKDTIESILVAFILAFVFRAFVVEAFVIPTGSMAPTLMGAHMRFHCADCGYDFAVNFSTGKSDMIFPARMDGTIRTPIYCPNCGFSIRDSAGGGEDSLTDPGVHYGDRILVLKYRYLLSGPERWDVIVFKSPDKLPEEDVPHYTTNYIKRLIGKPGESIMILDGDIYVSTTLPPKNAGELADAYRIVNGRFKLGDRPSNLEDRPNAQDKIDAKNFIQFLKTFRVQRKPAHAQDALWRNIYDNDYLPHLAGGDRSGKPWHQPWVAAGGSGWDIGQNLPASTRGRTRLFHFDNASGASTLAFDSDANPDTHAFSDFLAYDQFASPNGTSERNPRRRNTVSDLKLSCFYKRESGDGPFRMSLSKRDQKFVVELTPGQATLSRVDLKTGNVVKQYGSVTLPSTSSSLRLDLANVDYRASLRINDVEVLASGDDYEPTPDDIVRIEDDEQDQKDARPPEVKIEAANQKSTLEHISLSRDIFYINDYNYVQHGQWEKMAQTSFLGSPDNIVTLKPDEYFAMGDNSLISGDGRMWKNNVVLPGEDLPFVEHGRVPARFLLGKAFFVYWPAGHRPFGWNLGIIPNFGEMRFIR